MLAEQEMNVDSFEKKSKQVTYLAFHKSQFVAGVLFIIVGVVSLVYYDYGLLTFLFAFPQFFVVGLLPMLAGIIIVVRILLETERVEIISTDDYLTVNAGWIKKKTIKFEKSTMKYSALRYRETRAKRWVIAVSLMTIAVEVILINAVDLYGYARIAPILSILFVLIIIGIIIFIFFPRRYIEIGINERTVFIPYKNLSKTQVNTLLQMFDLNPDLIKRQDIKDIIQRNITSQVSTFVLGVFLLFLGILFSASAVFYYGTFTRVIALALGMKLILRVLSGVPFFNETNDQNFYLGQSPRLTFIKTIDVEVNTENSFSPLRYHPLEIFCFWYLISQALKYGFRFVWWTYLTVNWFYFIIAILLIGLIFIRWFNPIAMRNLKFRDFSIAIWKPGLSISRSNKFESFRNLLSQKVRLFLSDFKDILTDKQLFLSIIIFALFLLTSAIYYLIGGYFLLF